MLEAPVVVRRVLEALDVRSAGRLATCSAGLRALVDADDAFWDAEKARLDTTTQPARKRKRCATAQPRDVPARQSARLRVCAKESCRRAFVLRSARTEIFLLRLQKLAAGGHLSVTSFRALVASLEPLLLRKFFPVLQSSALIEIVKARGASQAKINAVLRFLLNAHANDAGESGTNSKSASSSSTEEGRRKRKLLHHGSHPFPVDAAGDDGMTALCIACARGLYTVASTLLAAGASPSALGSGCFESPSRTRIKGSFTPLGWAQHMIAAISKLADQSGQDQHAELLRNLRRCETLMKRNDVHS
ncbi:Hypothetical Protein FCC1311_014922 [Hondaea fermentalgiana]|uniref:Uncharacterized protein n=1 Tax=Hondaea fermentalgiana TaxID=2315210 RepID=A0A2R5G3Z7_9STRA|nr:Hypothetical Protein FCC1311_014922 [Hondaea fermentalgiana]|eukprot:GBG25275.1 Hypothetical Protein FCC1311_014922 [Hondaea fermentalgiana]